MTRKALEDTNYELIKAHVLDPENSPLPEDQQQMMKHIMDAAHILDKNPIPKHAAALLQAKYPAVSRAMAYVYLRMATRLFNSIHTFDYETWHTWLINDIVRNIEKCRTLKTDFASKTIAMEHANLLKAIGPKPTDTPDPERNEKHQFNIIIQAGGTEIKMNLKNLKDIPGSAIQEINQAIYGGPEITDTEAEEIMNS